MNLLVVIQVLPLQLALCRGRIRVPAVSLSVPGPALVSTPPGTTWLKLPFIVSFGIVIWDLEGFLDVESWGYRVQVWNT